MVEDESSVEAFKDFTIDDAGGAKSAPKPTEQEPPQKEAEEPEPEPKEDQKQPKQSSEPTKKEEPSTSSSSTKDFGGPIFASPIARRLALEHGIPLKQIKGSGPGNRIIKSDIEKYLSSAPATSPGGAVAAAPQTSAAGAQVGQGYTDIPLTGMRKTIAKRLSESMFTAPHYYLTSSINMTK